MSKKSAVHWSPSMGNKKNIAIKRKAKGASMRTRLSSPTTQIWRSRLSWRIALSVFLTILTVQVSILALTVSDIEQGELLKLENAARQTLAPALDQKMVSMLESPLQEEIAQRLINKTDISGLAVYSLNYDLLGSFGEPVILSMTQNKNAQNYRSNDGNFYEVVFRPSSLGRPFIIVTRVNSTAVNNIVYSYVERTILIMLLMSAFVTTVLMIALGHWLLEPILFMRDNLIRASEDPENPKQIASPFDPSDEIGSAIDLAQKLIKQNADNIKRIKSAAEDQIHKLAYYDTLTTLPNRTLFLITLNEMARASEDEEQGRFAVVALDLDHFKDINDSMGHNIGDAILRAIGKRLRASLPESAVVSRSGEDEFAITMALTGGTEARDIAERVAGVIRSEPFKVFNENFQVRASIGVATYPDDGVDPDQVLKHADIALNRAKEDGRDTIKEYSEDFDRAVQQRFQMLRDLRDAMEHDQLTLFYQPQLDLQKGTVIGAEALIRWFKPDNSKEGGQYISPADFIPIAEQSGLIVPIGEWVLKTACFAAAEWNAAGHDFRIAVNVSGAQFYQSDLVALVQKTLSESGLPAHKLELEVTESIFMDDVNHAIQTLQHLHSLGVELAIDDFGTGYSSLSYLRQFPIDRLKIDQSFIRNALNNPDDAAIARTIVRLGHSLNLKVIAEGVETKEHEDFLLSEECDEVQGFRYSRPVPNEEFKAFVATYTNDLSSFDKE
jgi:diguanylate cyclase (GGDEF)-like protein